MEIEKGIVPPKMHSASGEQTRYPLNDVVAGDSMWVPNNAKRCSLLSTFRIWKKNHQSKLVATSSKVGKEDKRGPGYRVWFLEPDQKA